MRRAVATFFRAVRGWSLAPADGLLTSVWVVVQGGSPYVQPDKTVHDPKTANGDLELGPNKPITAPPQQKAVP